MVNKILIAFLTIVISVTLMFLVIQSMPGDPVEMMANEITRTEQISYEIAYERAKAILNYDKDKPLIQRYLEYTSGILKGNLGTSMAYKRSVLSIVKDALPWTLFAASLSLFLSFIVGISIGLYIAWKQSKTLNTILIAYQSIVGSIPNYIIAYLLVFIFSVTLGWLPARGAYSSKVKIGLNIPFLINVLKHSILPVLSLFLTTVSGWIMSMKANALSVLGEDYMNYAQARGLSDRRILFSYLSKNAILPMITSLSVSFGLLFGGSPLIESLFLYPGVGYFLNLAITKRDYPLMQGMFFIIIVMVVFSSILAEFLYKYLNPRLRDE